MSADATTGFNRCGYTKLWDLYIKSESNIKSKSKSNIKSKSKSQLKPPTKTGEKDASFDSPSW